MKGSSIKRGVGLCAALLALTAAVAATLGHLPTGLQLLAGHGPRPSSTVGTDKPAPSAQLSPAPPASYVPVGSPILTAYRLSEPGITADNRALSAAGDPDGLVGAGAFPMAAPPATTASGEGAAPDASI
jgi:hypothetical protein